MIYAIALRALGWLRSVNPLVFIIAGLAFVAWLGWHRAEHWKARDMQDRATIAAMQTASKAELARAQAERDAAIKHEKEQNDATDARVAAARADDARRLDAYLVRLRGEFARQRGQVPTAGQANVEQGGDRSGPGSIMDALSDDLAICTTNSRRLMELHNEAIAP